MSKRTCYKCHQIYNSNDPGRMTVCFKCCPPSWNDLEQEEPMPDSGEVHDAGYGEDYTCDCEACKMVNDRSYNEDHTVCKGCDAVYGDCDGCPDEGNCALGFTAARVSKNTNTVIEDDLGPQESIAHDDACICEECIPPPPPEFKVDYHETDPTLHLLFVKWAVRDLAMIRKMIKKIYNSASGNTCSFGAVLNMRCAELISTNAAWAEAQEILNSIKIRSLKA